MNSTWEEIAAVSKETFLNAIDQETIIEKIISELITEELDDIIKQRWFEQERTVINELLKHIPNNTIESINHSLRNIMLHVPLTVEGALNSYLTSKKRTYLNSLKQEP